MPRGENIVTTQHIGPSGTGHQNHHSGQGTQIVTGGGNVKISIKHSGSDNKYDEASRVHILKTLYAVEYPERKDRNDNRIPGTCEWFKNHHHFKQWRESDYSSMLWVSADPGCGKSVLAKYLADGLETNEGRRPCYFFFKDDYEDQRSAKNALRCLLYQLFEQNGNLLSDKIIKLFKTYEKPLAASPYELGELWSILVLAAQGEDSGETICILDALDECRDNERHSLAKLICEFYGPNNDTKKRVNLKFLITSRPYDKIKRDFESALDADRLSVIHLKGEGDKEAQMIAKEIDIFIENRVSHIQTNLSLTHLEQQQLLRRLRAVPNRTYLWVCLTLKWIDAARYKFSQADIRKMISNLPQSVDEAYQKILANSTDETQTKKLLHIIVAAERPLTVAEIGLMMAMRQQIKCYETLDHRPDERVKQDIRDICGLFVTIYDEKVYLLHQTAKEFLVPGHNTGVQAKQSSQLTWKSSLLPSHSHRIICEICVWHLLFTKFETQPLAGEAIVADYLRDNLFLEYSAKNWATHFHASDIKESEFIQSLRQICDVTSNRCLTWLKVYWADMQTEIPLHFTTLMIASYFGLKEIVKSELGLRDISIDAVDYRYQRSALSWASENGFDSIVELLIRGPNTSFWNYVKWPFSKGAKIDARDIYGRTPLSYACLNGYLPVVQKLVEAGASVTSTDKIHGTPISYALCTGHTEIVDELSKGTRADSRDDIRRELLLSAIKHDDKLIVKRLIDSGANIEVVDSYNATPLHYAVKYENMSITRLLLLSGANTEAADTENMTPLYSAINNGSLKIAQLLLENGANIEVVGMSKRY
ncbi:ANK_REP_REGION domain-containing protein [Trichoderma simmonsii]|uniref:ANK_REP_REGION domain-containing protein n=1 Tax=Trichoderma simmonsii TaxID=1491479 RepID=A0A8G0LKE0_9HYPO|nr:ANK_REP_REGION domain-containing protein [Trichoderma simmonsii]